MCNLYVSESGKPILIPSFVLYADILGFTAMSNKAIKCQNEIDFLRRLKAALSSSYSQVRERAQLLGMRDLFNLKVFTDNIVMGYPLNRPNIDYGEPELLDVLSIFSELQMSLAIEGFLLRGSIAYGNHYMDEDIVFGDAFLHAVSLDKHKSPPRIVIAQSVVDIIQKHADCYGSIKNIPAYRHLLDDEGVLFLNYLEEVFNYFPEGGILYDMLEGHKHTVSKGLEIYKKCQDGSIQKKYEWVAMYHNYICKDFLESHPVPQDPDADAEYGSACEEALRLSDYLVCDNANEKTFSRISF